MSRRVTGIDFGRRRASRVYFLHAAAWANGRVGEYRVHYATVQEVHETIPLVTGVNIGDWWNPREMPEAPIGWKNVNELASVGLFLYEWKNPHPETPIRSIDFISTSKYAVPAQVAVTGRQ